MTFHLSGGEMREMMRPRDEMNSQFARGIATRRNLSAGRPLLCSEKVKNANNIKHCISANHNLCSMDLFSTKKCNRVTFL